VECGLISIDHRYYPNCQVSEYVKERIIALREQHPGQVRVGVFECIVLLHDLFRFCWEQ
jgi:hypothetical protein